MSWSGRRVLITGGASFIGATLSRRLIESGANVRAIDNLSTGRLDSIRDFVSAGDLDFREHDVEDAPATADALKDVEYVFHLAANHGGRGYITHEQVRCSTNLMIDSTIIRLAAEAGVHNFVFASSGCVYPRFLQADPSRRIVLTEDLVGPPYDPDTMYGWSKLTGEQTLAAYTSDGKLPSVSCRYFTVYGPNNTASHALQALIERAARREDPFEIWGDGSQVRNWTYVDDIVDGTMRAALRVRDGSAINLGTDVATTVREAAEMICELFDYRPDFLFRPDMPTGPLNRVASHARATDLLGWTPQTHLRDGLAQTIDWYRSTQTALPA